MALLSLHDVSLNLGGPQLLDEVALHIESGERVCLVGRNGAGKSTLMRLIGGEIAPDSGRISFQKGATWAYLPQDVAPELNGPARSVVIDGREVPDYEIDALLMQLKIDGDAEFKTLSGGQQRRALLARALAGEPDLLLLDEPTNHLDIESIQWLEEYLLKSGRGNGKSLLFVTHDRAFLQNLATRIIEIDRAKIYSYECDYETFLTRREERIESQIKTNAVFDVLLKQEEAWIRRGVKARTTRNEGRVRALQKMRQERSARREGTGKAILQAQDVERSGMEVINAQDVSFSYEADKPLVRDFSTLVIRGDKLGFVGPNGGGKTTLLKVLLGEIEPQSGRAKLGTRLHLAYFDQNRGGLDGDKSVRWNVAGENDTVAINGERRHIVGYLQEWLFSPDRIRQPVKTLSGGERSRLLLAKLFTQPANVLVMDEPTNDLDIETLELLEEMLVEFPGTVIVVSHDRAFLNNVVTGTLSPDGGGYWSEFVGGYDDLMRQRRAQNGHQSTLKASETKKIEAPKPIVRPKKMSFNEKRELEALPALIEKLELENAALIEKMGDAEFYKGDSSQVATTKKRMEQIEAELAKAFARWEELEALMAASAT